MKILAVGGGSGGHVTPVVAVLRELKKLHPEAEVRFWCDRKFAPQARGIMAHYDASMPVETIFSGKLRRYHHLKWWNHLRPSILLPNLRDGFLVGVGSVQSFFKLLNYRPDVVFTKGGFVCVPVGLAAHLLKIPIVIHDSDAHPGLANRILARWAKRIATGAPLEFYPYPADISVYTGTPVDEAFGPLSETEQRAAKQAAGVDPNRPLVAVTGGGLGAKRLNDVVAATLVDLLPRTSVILVSGAGQYDELRAITPENDPGFVLLGFVKEGMASLLGAADIVVGRAGATSVLEFAALAKPTILVPNGRLTGGHQLKNAQVYAAGDAVKILNDDELNEHPEMLTEAIFGLLDNPAERARMASELHKFAKPNAASQVAKLVIEAAKS